MEIKRVITGYLEENCYILINNNDCLIIDPGSESSKIIENIKNLNLIGILITHHHFDHVGALDDILKFKNIDIYDYKLEEKEYKINSFIFDIIKTNGHTNDSVSFYFKNENTLFSGDFIFKDTIGRTDLPTGSINEMNNSINKIKKMDENTIIYPGHGDKTTLKYELENNIYLK